MLSLVNRLISRNGKLRDEIDALKKQLEKAIPQNKGRILHEIAEKEAEIKKNFQEILDLGGIPDTM